MKFSRFTASAIYALTHIGFGSALAADNELYDAPPPADAAFVRWVGLGNQHPVFGVAPVEHIMDAYRPVSASATNGAQPGGFYTVAKSSDGQIMVIKEPDRRDKSKVQLLLLNLGEAPAQLVVTDQDMVVIGDTVTGRAGSQMVNPVAASLTVRANDGRELGTFDVSLRRGQNLTFVAYNETVRLIENSYGPNLGG